ncbi:MAG: hypothetical protein ACPGQL_04775 [Thermoplasmatota archaeon]
MDLKDLRGLSLMLLLTASTVLAGCTDLFGGPAEDDREGLALYTPLASRLPGDLATMATSHSTWAALSATYGMDKNPGDASVDPFVARQPGSPDVTVTPEEVFGVFFASRDEPMEGLSVFVMAFDDPAETDTYLEHRTADGQGGACHAMVDGFRHLLHDDLHVVQIDVQQYETGDPSTYRQAMLGWADQVAAMLADERSAERFQCSL